MDRDVLPPMPPSDDEALAKNKYDSFYKLTSRDFWGENKVIKIEETPMTKCEHKFIPNEGGVLCTKCKMGLLGQIEVQDGKLFYKGEQVGL